jgi:Na+-driven multidrug efflux pump
MVVSALIVLAERKVIRDDPKDQVSRMKLDIRHSLVSTASFALLSFMLLYIYGATAIIVSFLNSKFQYLGAKVIENISIIITWITSIILSILSNIFTYPIIKWLDRNSKN